MLRLQFLPQLAYVASCEWWSKSSGSTISPLMTCQVSKLWQKLLSTLFL